jgi:hypothetical protein
LTNFTGVNRSQTCWSLPASKAAHPDNQERWAAARMSGNLIALFELLLVFGLVMWFGIAELRSLKKLKTRPREKTDKDPSSDTSKS